MTLLSFSEGQDPIGRGGSGDRGIHTPPGGLPSTPWRAWEMLSVDPHMEEAGEKG